MFIGMMVYILVFTLVFGQDNILIGVASITALLMLVERDLTTHPIANTVKFSLLNLLSGIAAFAAGFSMWGAIPLNFITMFIISYTLIFNLKNPLYFPFSLQYLFLLAMPVTLSQMPLRLLALVVGAASIMVWQMVKNRKRMTENGDSVIKEVAQSLLEKIDKKLADESADEVSEAIRKSIGSLRALIYDRREEDYYLTDEGRLRLNVSAALEKIDALLEFLEPRHEKGDIIHDVRELLTQIAQEESDEIDGVALSKASEEILESYRTNPPESSTQIRLLNNVDYLTDSLLALQQLSPQKRKIARKFGEIPRKFQKFTLRSGGPRHVTSLKMSYAIRIAIGIAFSGFLMDLFNLEEGRWMMFTVLSVIIPFYEQSHKKMRDRIFATVVGSILVFILFGIFQATSVRLGLLLLAGYLMSYIHVYRYSTIIVTFTAIGFVAMLTGETNFLTVERIGMVLSGIVIALLINKFVLPYRLTDANQHLKEMSNENLGVMLVEAKDAISGHVTEDSNNMKNLLIFNTMIEERARVNLKAAGDETADEVFGPRRLASNTLYELLMWKEMHGMTEDIQEQSVQALKRLHNYWEKQETNGTLLVELHHTMTADPVMVNKIILNILIETTEQFELIRKDNETL